MESDLQKQLRIKSGSLRRIQKEHHSYVLEEQKLRGAHTELQSSGSEELQLRKHQELIDEVISVLPGAKSRLQDAFNDLQQWIAEYGDDILIKDTPQKATSEEILAVAKDYLDQINTIPEEAM